MDPTTDFWLALGYPIYSLSQSMIYGQMDIVPVVTQTVTYLCKVSQVTIWCNKALDSPMLPQESRVHFYGFFPMARPMGGTQLVDP